VIRSRCQPRTLERVRTDRQSVDRRSGPGREV